KEHAVANIYTDSVNIKTLTPSVWYKIAAIDNRYNMSEFSDIVEVKIPDVIPPVPPVIKNVTANHKGVAIHFVPSSSADVVRHEIYRRRMNSQGWLRAGTVLKKDSCLFLDSL